MVAVRPRVGVRRKGTRTKTSKELVQECRLPWQKPQKNLTPYRVAQSMISLLVQIGSPTIRAKTRGKSAGFKIGQTRSKRKRYPIVKKRFSRRKKNKKNTTWKVSQRQVVANFKN